MIIMDTLSHDSSVSRVEVLNKSINLDPRLVPNLLEVVVCDHECARVDLA